MKKMIFGCLYLTISAFYFPVHDADAVRLKVEQNSDNSSVVASSAKAVDALQKPNGLVRVKGKTAGLAVLDEGTLRSVVLAYKIGSRVLPASTVLADPQKYCADNSAKAYTGLRGAKVRIQLENDTESSIAYHSGKISKKGKPFPSRRTLTGLVPVDENCIPLGVESLGLAKAGSEESGSSKFKIDADRDGIIDIFDVDTDGDGVLNNFDSTYTPFRGSYSLFSYIKADITETVNVNAFGRDLMQSEVNQLVGKTALAVEVKANGTEESELDCGELSYCSAGGTGTVANTSDAFPGAAGGTYDSDSDGKGTIEKGSTGDFQLATNVSSFSDINAGDSILQEVTNSSGLQRFYTAALQFVFRATPALKSVVLDPDGTADTTTFSYPVNLGETGTSSNCLSVTPNSEGDIIFDMTAWRPQRKGVAALGEASFVELGNALISIELPNEPDATGSTNGNGPKMCPASSYSNLDALLTAEGDELRDSLGDIDADTGNTVQFRVNITDCLASAGQTLDSGEKVKMAIQFKSDAGDNAAQSICIERP